LYWSSVSATVVLFAISFPYPFKGSYFYLYRFVYGTILA
jgi:hypothetical protein